MKTLLALVNCHTRKIYAQAQRETWIPKLPPELEYRFFLGPSDREPALDEVFLPNCDDSYRGLPSKVREIAHWALMHGYDCMAKIDDDVVLKPAEFLASGFQNHDFVGHNNYDHASVLIPWGFCYTLSRKAMEIVAGAELPRNNNDEAWVAHTLAAHGIALHDESRYCLYTGKCTDFIVPTKRPLRAPPRTRPMDEGAVPPSAIAYCVYINWFGFHATPDEVNIKTYHKIFKETQ